jgi:hypothetical protein
MILLFAAGVAMVWLQILVALEMDVSLAPMGGESRMAFQLVYPFALALSGVGAVLAERWRPAPSFSLRVAGAGILLSLAICLRVHLALPTDVGFEAVARAILHLAGLSVPMLALSAAVAGAWLDAHVGGSRVLGRAVAVHLAGLLCGYALVAPLLRHVGANAGLAALGLALLAGGRRGIPAIPVVVAIAGASGVDRALERVRVIDTEWADKTAGDDEGEGSPRVLARFLEMEPLHLDWGLYHQFRVAKGHRGDIVGFYGWMMQWTIPRPDRGRESPSEKLRKAVYGLAESTDSVLLLCSGGGRGLLSFPFPPHRGITAVERVDNVVRWLASEEGRAASGAASGARTIGADARYVLDTRQDPADLVIIESGRFQPMGWATPVGSQDTLFTLEGIGRAAALLSDEGLLMLHYHRVTARRSDRYLAGLRVIDELGLPRMIVALDPTDDLVDARDRYVVDCGEASACWDVYIVAARDIGPLDLARTRLADVGGVVVMDDLDLVTPVAAAPLITDARPFATWYSLDGAAKTRVLSVIVAGVTVLLGALGALAQARPLARRAVVPFASLGAGWIIVLTHTLYSFRAAMTGPMQTTLWATAAMMAWGTIGSLLAPRLSGLLRSRGRIVAFVLVPLVVHALLLEVIPFGWGSDLARAVFLVAAVAPAGIALGALLPLGLARLDPSLVAPALLADAMGTGLGALVFYLVALSLGFEVWFLVGVAAYVLAALTLPGSRSAVAP